MSIELSIYNKYKYFISYIEWSKERGVRKVSGKVGCRILYALYWGAFKIIK